MKTHSLQADSFSTQQPNWKNNSQLMKVINWLRSQTGLLDSSEIISFRQEMGRIYQEEGFVLQAGDCVEPFSEFDHKSLATKISFIGEMANELAAGRRGAVIQIGRIAGQFGKPRTNNYENVDGLQLPVFRGEIVNGHEPTQLARKPNPWRMCRAYSLSKKAIQHLSGARAHGHTVWTSHEALILDYEQALARPVIDHGSEVLTSTHMPWVGERTADLRGPHISLLQSVSNTVGVKVGPNMAADTLDSICETLNPGRENGRLVLIFRFGVNKIKESASRLLRMIRHRQHNVIAVVDPMHGNTRRSYNGQKTRTLEDIEYEVREFIRIAHANSIHPGGLHLETTPFDVTECVGLGVSEEDLLRDSYTTLCDPRLNAEQALHVVDSFRDALS